MRTPIALGVLLALQLTLQLSPSAAAEPAKPATPKELAERFANLPANGWIAIEPLPSERLVLQSRAVDAKVEKVTSREPAFREYTSPAFGDGKIFYFGGGHSGYYGNDVEIYDPATNAWRQCYRPNCPPKDDSTYYSGGSERCYVDPATGAGQPYVIHGYARTGYDPALRRYVCTAMFPTKVERDAATNQWRLVRQAFSYIAFDERTNKWELLSEVPDALKPGATSLSYDAGRRGMIAFSEHAAYLFADKEWQKLGDSEPRLAASGGAGGIYLPERKAHLLAILGHGGKKEVGSLSLFDVEKQRGERGPALPDDLQRRVAAGTGGYNLIAAYDARRHQAVFMSTSDDHRPEVWTYDPSTSAWTALPASTTAPKLVGPFEPGRGRAPLLYDPERNVFFLLYRDGEKAKLWAYRLGK